MAARSLAETIIILRGRYGIPYTVGEILPPDSIPNLVFDENKNRL